MLSIFTGATSFGSLLYEGVPKMSLSVTHLLVLGHDQVMTRSDQGRSGHPRLLDCSLQIWYMFSTLQWL